MKLHEDKQLGYLFDSLHGEAWKIKDCPDQLTSAYNIAQKGSIHARNQVAGVKWEINPRYSSSCLYPIFQSTGSSHTFLEVQNTKRNKELKITRTGGLETVELTFPLKSQYWHHIQSLTSQVEKILPEVEREMCSNQCSCSDCVKGQKKILEDPKTHPIYMLLENIVRSGGDYYFRLEGENQRAIAKIRPHRMETIHGVCTIISEISEISIDLTQLFFIRVEQHCLNGIPHSVLQGRSHNRDKCFSLYSPGLENYEAWVELVNEGSLVP